MILGTFVRNFKTYSGINYIPISDGQKFCGLVGNNGIGKSSVLEALDCCLNKKSWNYNVIVKKSGFSTTKPHIVPLYFIQIEEISDYNIEIAKTLSDYMWSIEEADVLPQNRIHFKVFEEQRSILKRDFNSQEWLLIPLGETYESLISLSIFNTKKLGELFIKDFDKTNQQIQDSDLDIFVPLHEEIRGTIEYIYIPKDVDPENFAQLETAEIQSLMGETLNDIVEKCVPQTKIQEINQNLGQFIDSLTSILGQYSFRTTGERQVNLRKNDVYKLIIDAYFKIRKLHKKENDHWLELGALSSGEKQKAIIEIAYQFLKNYRKHTNNLIIAIDEPESSLHMSACYDQFNKLFEISNLCQQLLFTTHWYGFIPTVENGNVSVISKSENQHRFDIIRINSYREGVKQAVRDSKGRLPYDIRLKSINDFVQSIITSILSDEPFNWLICEGSSEKIYFEKYLHAIKREKKLRIIPVGGAGEIKRIYNYLMVAYEDFRKEVQGKVILISDTDTEIVQYDTKSELRNLICYRIINDEAKRKTRLVRIESNQVSPKTEIEDALNGKLFYETLVEFSSMHTEIRSIIRDINEPIEEESYFSLDLSPSKQKLLESFFDKENNKFSFARKYTEKMDESFKIPEWINDIINIYMN